MKGLQFLSKKENQKRKIYDREKSDLVRVQDLFVNTVMQSQTNLSS